MDQIRFGAGDFRHGPSNAAGQRAHSALVRAILADLGAEDDVALHVNPVGEAEVGSIDSTGTYHQRHQVVGLGPGSPDIVGWITPPAGRPAVVFCLEAKTGRAVLNNAQREWHAAHKARGVLVYTVHSPEEARRALTDARRRVGR